MRRWICAANCWTWGRPYSGISKSTRPSRKGSRGICWWVMTQACKPFCICFFASLMMSWKGSRHVSKLRQGPYPCSNSWLLATHFCHRHHLSAGRRMHLREGWAPLSRWAARPHLSLWRRKCIRMRIRSFRRWRMIPCGLWTRSSKAVAGLRRTLRLLLTLSIRYLAISLSPTLQRDFPCFFSQTWTLFAKIQVRSRPSLGILLHLRR